jgi:O-antigen/teichoic acid export membrane protein
MMTVRPLIVNAIWNLSGHAVPIVFALVAIPALIAGLGEARFAIVALGWLVTGYFALFDFGVGRAATRLMAMVRRDSDAAGYAAIFRHSLILHIAFACLGGGLFALAVPWLVSSAFAIPADLAGEARLAFWWLAFSVPALILSSAFRAVLEAEQRFDLVNLIKVPASSLNYAAALVVIQFAPRVDWIIAVIAVSRWLVLFATIACCLRYVTLDRISATPDVRLARGLVMDGGWFTVAGLVVPLMLMIDRLLISNLYSLEAVTYYVVPYEVITKLWIFSASLLGALFPLMSAHRGRELRAMSSQSLRYLLMAATPAVLIAILFGQQLLTLWVGASVAAHSTAVLQVLAVGVWFNVLAQVPQTALQAAGHASVVGKLSLIELPLYAALAWWLTLQFGIVGAASAWTLRSALNALCVTGLLGHILKEFHGWPWRVSNA